MFKYSSSDKIGQCYFKWTIFIRPSQDGSYYVIVYGGRPHRFLHNNLSSVYQIFTKFGHMIPMWKGKNPVYFRVIRSKVKVIITINRIFDNRVVFRTITLVLFIGVYWIFNKLGHMIPLWKGKNPIYFGVITIIPFDNLYRRGYFLMHTFLV
jgi:hypothetical protein